MDKLAMLSEILSANPHDAFARYGYAMELVSQGKITDGLAAFDECIASNPDYVPAYQMSAQTLAAHGQRELAIARLHGGIKAAQETGNAHARSEMEALRDELTGH